MRVSLESLDKERAHVHTIKSVWVDVLVCMRFDQMYTWMSRKVMCARGTTCNAIVHDERIQVRVDHVITKFLSP